MPSNVWVKLPSANKLLPLAYNARTELFNPLLAVTVQALPETL